MRKLRPKRLTHLAPRGARMVDVSAKACTAREARAEAWVNVGREIAALLRASGQVAKGDVLATARLAGIQAAKRTPELIPLCHPLPLDWVEVVAELRGTRVRLESRVACTARTGVEMEAMVTAAVAALTVYDMVKSAGKGVTIEGVRLLSKSGGKSGTWRRRGSARG